MLKLIAILNWLVIAVLGFLIIAEALSPHKGGGDAAGRGMGQAIYYLAIAVFVILLVLNLLPFKATKIAAFLCIMVPAAYFLITPNLRKLKRHLAVMRENAKPIYDDPEMERLARIIQDGDAEKLRKTLPEVSPKWQEQGELLGFAIGEATHSSYKASEKRNCIKVLFEAGASLDSLADMDVPVHFPAASNGNAAVLGLLLEKGADANAFQPYFKRPILFEALGGYQEPEVCVKLLLQYGADPNAVIMEDSIRKTPLQVAAEMERWGVCVALLDQGADPAKVSRKGLSFRDWVHQAALDFHENQYGQKADLEELLKRFP